MEYFVKEWSDKTASIFAEDGYILDTYSCIYEAVKVCREECLVEPMWVETSDDHQSPLESRYDTWPVPEYWV